jgi:hypothetical protein
MHKEDLVATLDIRQVNRNLGASVASCHTTTTTTIITTIQTHTH